MFNPKDKSGMHLGVMLGGNIGLYNPEGAGVRLQADKEGGYVGIYKPNSGVPVLIINQDSFVPQKDKWGALYLTAYLNTGGWALTQKLNQTSFTVVPSTADELKLEAQVNTTCQPTWNFHLGQGRFSVSDREVRVAYEEAGNYIFTTYIQPAFPFVSKDEVRIGFSIGGYEVGTWRNGIMKLKGE